jgi:hypothetical protein
MKVGVFYLSAGLLMFLLGMLLLRGVVAAVTWIASGRTLWLLPTILAEVRACLLGGRLETIL